MNRREFYVSTAQARLTAAVGGTDLAPAAQRERS